LARRHRLAVDRDAAHRTLRDLQIRDLGLADHEPVRERRLAERRRQEAAVDPRIARAVERAPNLGKGREDGTRLLGRKLGIAVCLRSRPAQARPQPIERSHFVLAHRDRQRAAHRIAGLPRPFGRQPLDQLRVVADRLRAEALVRILGG
jgi:hypothetical protein